MTRQGRTAWDLAREFEPTAATIRLWIRQAGIDAGEIEGATTDEKAELVRLRRENAVLREEKEILAKAAAWFAEETGRTPGHAHSDDLNLHIWAASSSRASA